MLSIALTYLKVLVVGALIGFLGGAFGKGGSAVATPMLQLAGVSAFYAVASPLPATIPSTLLASVVYLRRGLYDRPVVLWTVLSGLPATIVGAWLSDLFGGKPLLVMSDLVVVVLGISFLVAPTGHLAPASFVPAKRARTVAIGTAVGFLSGLLANSGGFLFAPLYVRVLKMELRAAFACSLVASAVLAVPGTVMHVALGHVSWPIVLVLALASVPLANLGARASVTLDIEKVEIAFGVVMVVIGLVGLMHAIG